MFFSDHTLFVARQKQLYTHLIFKPKLCPCSLAEVQYPECPPIILCLNTGEPCTLMRIYYNKNVNAQRENFRFDKSLIALEGKFILGVTIVSHS
jgi:hypothetical protein